tara:strand:+ start:9214 stop:9471 length:258 start_codon:yes stop_codon:yes gene_type:complete
MNRFDTLLFLWQWSWKDIRTHFLLHCSDHVIARTFACRQLQTARYAVEQRLMRVEGDNKELDKQNCELMLKVRPHPKPLSATLLF